MGIMQEMKAVLLKAGVKPEDLEDDGEILRESKKLSGNSKKGDKKPKESNQRVAIMKSRQEDETELEPDVYPRSAKETKAQKDKRIMAEIDRLRKERGADSIEEDRKKTLDKWTKEK